MTGGCPVWNDTNWEQFDCPDHPAQLWSVAGKLMADLGEPESGETG